MIELIQYSPTTPDVHAEPVLIVPAWIMKYYILDLSPKNSLVAWLVDQGYTVFMMSWKNPTAADRELGMDDYLRKGVYAALDVVGAVVPDRDIHAVGYCIGGTLLSIAAAALADWGDTRIRDVTLFAAQTDFSEPGELSLYISPAQLEMLEALMYKEGVLDSKQMGGAFAMLRAHDLLWQPAVKSYLKGERDGMIDLMAWNADGTRMPWKMHTEYLMGLYLRNDLAEGRFKVEGEPVSLKDIRVPMFVVGTETDHVAPWKSVYKVGGLTSSSEFTFLLTSGGHNAGIVSGPVHPKRRHRVRTQREGESAAAGGRVVRDDGNEAGFLVADLGRVSSRPIPRRSASRRRQSARRKRVTSRLPTRRASTVQAALTHNHEDCRLRALECAGRPHGFRIPLKAANLVSASTALSFRR